MLCGQDISHEYLFNLGAIETGTLDSSYED